MMYECTIVLNDNRFHFSTDSSAFLFVNCPIPIANTIAIGINMIFAGENNFVYASWYQLKKKEKKEEQIYIYVCMKKFLAVKNMQ